MEHVSVALKSDPKRRRRTSHHAAKSTVISKTVLWCALKSIDCKRRAPKLRLNHTPANIITLLCYALPFTDDGNYKCGAMYDRINLFYLKNVKYNTLLASDEAPEYLSAQSKRYIHKIVLLYAVAR